MLNRFLASKLSGWIALGSLLFILIAGVYVWRSGFHYAEQKHKAENAKAIEDGVKTLERAKRYANDVHDVDGELIKLGIMRQSN